MSQYHTKSSITSKGDRRLNEEDLKSAATTKSAFFSPSTCTELANVAVGGLMPLNIEDLREWDADPENYMLMESQATATDDVKSAGQQLFLSLVESKTGWDMIGSYLGSLILDFEAQMEAARIECMETKKRTASDSPASLSALVRDTKILQWDAVLTAAGVASYDLRGKVVEFSSWFTR